MKKIQAKNLKPKKLTKKQRMVIAAIAAAFAALALAIIEIELNRKPTAPITAKKGKKIPVIQK